jgi:predicted enzyme related to lactoylglutathione lyase
MSEQAATAEQMAMPKHGEFCWNDLATTNLEACKKFYSELLGWQFKDSSATGMVYSEISVDGQKYVGGMWQTDQCHEGNTSEMPPLHWMTYIAVDDVDQSAAKVVELGGSVCVAPTDIPNTGRFAVINDPTGATFSLITLRG